MCHHRRAFVRSARANEIKGYSSGGQYFGRAAVQPDPEYVVAQRLHLGSPSSSSIADSYCDIIRRNFAFMFVGQNLNLLAIALLPFFIS